MALLKISGEVEVLGQSTFNQVVHHYAFIRVLTSDGRVETLNSVKVSNAVSSYLSAGATVDLFIFKWGSDNVIFAIKTGSRFADDISFWSEVKSGCAVKGIFFVALGIPACLILIGFLMLLEGLRQLRLASSVPDVSAMKVFAAS